MKLQHIGAVMVWAAANAALYLFACLLYLFACLLWMLPTDPGASMGEWSWWLPKVALFLLVANAGVLGGLLMANGADIEALRYAERLRRQHERKRELADAERVLREEGLL